MIVKKEWIAMLLAGGQGSRLHILTENLAKPAVPFGGKYRIIDFSLSNCVNSGLDTVGVLTQYQPLVLNEYIGSGQPWDLDRVNGGIYVLPPYQKNSGSDWYTGTANAVYQNINFIDRYDPEYVLVLSGDHVYKMDYSKMLRFHKEKNSDCTIAVLEVPWEETSRFGILNTDADQKVVEFEEKPLHAKSNLASMGVYIFSWKTLRRYLIEDEQDPNSQKDFGKNILPKMLGDEKRMFAYPFDGYWKDVGTIDSLWEANMDLLSPSVPLDLYDSDWKIYSRNLALPPHYISETGKVQNSMVTEGCNIHGQVEFSILFSGVTVEPGAVVHDSIVMPGAVIRRNAAVEYAIISENAVIGENARVGCRPETMQDKDAWGIAVIGSGVQIAPGETVPPRAMVGRKGGEKR